MAQVVHSARPCRYLTANAIRWLVASAQNKAPTMRSSLTSSSRVNRASRGEAATSIGTEQTPPRRGWTSRVFMRARDRWPNSAQRRAALGAFGYAEELVHGDRREIDAWLLCSGNCRYGVARWRSRLLCEKCHPQCCRTSSYHRDG